MPLTSYLETSDPWLLEQLLDTAPVGLGFLDTELRFVRVNRALAEINGLPPEAHVGRAIREILPGLPASALEPLRRIAAGGPPVIDHEVSGETPAAPGVTRTWLESYHPVHSGTGDLIGVNAVVVEVTEERRKRRFIHALKNVASVLAGLTGESMVGQALLEQATGALGATRGAVRAVSLDGSSLDLLAVLDGVGAGPEPDRVPMSSAGAWVDAACTGRLRLYAGRGTRGLGYTRAAEAGLEAEGTVLVAGMPIHHRPRGALLLEWTGGRRLDRGERAFVNALTELAGQALDRVASERTVRLRALALAQTMSSIAVEVEPERIAGVLLHEAMPALGARFGLVRGVDGTGERPRLLHAIGLEDGAAGDAETLPLSGPAPCLDAIRQRRVIAVGTRRALRRRYPAFAERFAHLDPQAIVALPILAGARPVGSLLLGFDAPQRFDAAQLAFARALAEATAAALERARLLQDELRSRQLLLETIEQMPVGVIVGEPQRGLVFQNDEAGRILGRPLPLGPDLLGGAVAMHADGSPMVRAQWALARALDAGETVIGQEALLRRLDDGREISVQVSARPVLAPDGRVLAAAATLLDITGRRQAEDAREAFLGVLSHELRTPLTSIFGGASVLARHKDAVEPRLRSVVEDVAEETLRLLRLVDVLLVLARVERGVPLADPEPVLVQHNIRDVVRVEAERWPGCSFEIEMPGALPTVSGDAGHLEVVLRNLLANAAKYGNGRIRVWAAPLETAVQVCVEDDGPGLDGDPALLFRLFRRGERAQRQAPGAGIGLFLSRTLVEAMGGRMWAASSPGGGAAFYFTLPIEEDSGQ
jgi:PAS domain S-box-containing protein